jgi:hypothetical protein
MHCFDNSADRELGNFWEREFCKLAAATGYAFTPMQIGLARSAQFYRRDGKKWKQYTLPDVVIWTFPGQHHEIKHKNPTPDGCFGNPPMFGLEAYRYYALAEFAEIARQDVLYTIHNHDLSGGRNSKLNDIAHWMTARVTDLIDIDFVQLNGKTYVDGKKESGVKIFYWHIERWIPLHEYWQSSRAKIEPGHNELIPTT